jgi:TRAP-type C4-dicarboxylate transport system substrate-binding protein
LRRSFSANVRKGGEKFQNTGKACRSESYESNPKKGEMTMRIGKLLFTGVIIAVAFILMVITPDITRAKSMTLKVSHQFAAGDVRDRMGRVFGDMVTEKTNGEIKFRHYPAKSLYKPREQWDAMRRGALDMSVFPLDYASGKVPQLSITLMPAGVTNIKQGLTWRNKPIGKKVDALMEKNGVRNLVWAWFDGGLGSKVRQIKVPSDVKGTKLRAAGKKFEFMMQEAGASITSMPSSETYHALSTGVIDTMLTSSASFVSYRLYEVLKYINAPRDYSIWYMAENLCISQKTWDRLTPEQQKIFQETAEWMHENWIEANFKSLVDNLIKEYTKAGANVHYMTEAEFNEWLSFAKKTAWKSFAESVDGGQELLDLALEAMK